MKSRTWYKKISSALLVAGLAGSTCFSAQAAASDLPLSRITTVAGIKQLGQKNGPAAQAQFRFPYSVVQNTAGEIFVADSENHQICKITADGTVQTLAGGVGQQDKSYSYTGELKDGIGTSARFNLPQGIALDAVGNLYVADRLNHAIRKITPDGTVSTLAGSGKSGYQDGVGKAAQFNEPGDVAVGSDGTVYVADTLNHRIRKIAPDGTVRTLAGGQTDGAFRDGRGEEALFNEPDGIVVDHKGMVYVADTGNQRIRQITSDGIVQTLAGGGNEKADGANVLVGDFADGSGEEARFASPTGLSISPDGKTLYIADTNNQRIRALALDTHQVRTVAGAEESGIWNGIEQNARFDGPADVWAGAGGTLLVADNRNHMIRKITPELPATHSKKSYVQLYLNDNEITFPTAPLRKDNRLFVPIRAIGDALGRTIEWDARTQRVTLHIPNDDQPDKPHTFYLNVQDRNIYEGNTVVQTMDTAAFLYQGRVFVPVRYIADLNGVSVQWDEKNEVVTLRK